jgi:hypothetical protein
MNHLVCMAEVEGKIAQLEGLRGTPSEPPALDALIGCLRRTRAWHSVRLDQQHPNVGKASLFERSGRSKRTNRSPHSVSDQPLDGLVLA